MSRKKRTFETAPVPAPAKEKETVVHTDAFQKRGVEAVTDAARVLEGKGRSLAYGVAAVVLVAILLGLAYNWKRRSDEAGQAALGKAIETAAAPISASPAAGSTEKSFPTEKDRATAAVAEFEAVSQKFGGEISRKARYFAATARLVLDRATALGELETLAKEGGGTGSLAKFALAQAKNTDGKSEESLVLYRELAAEKDPVVSKETVNFEIAEILEKQGKKDEAVEAFFQIAKAASELKDSDGAGVPLSQTATKAKEKVEKLNPEKAKEIPTPAPAAPIGR